jgi:hypothetical protein
VIIALIANNGSDNVSTIPSFHQELLTQIAPQLNLPILSIGSDGAIVEFKAQVAIQSCSTNERLTFQNKSLELILAVQFFQMWDLLFVYKIPNTLKKLAEMQLCLAHVFLLLEIQQYDLNIY